MKILFVATEANPFIKTGGLADVAYALPKQLIKEKIDCRIVMPLHKKIKDVYKDRLEFITAFYVPMNERKVHVGMFKIVNEGVTYYFIDNEEYFNRDTIYYEDGSNDERFTYFNHAVLESLKYLDFMPDIIHFNDWHTGILPMLYHGNYKHQLGNYDIKFLYTIHNLKYQGVYNKDVLYDYINLDSYYYNGPNNIEFYNGINFMKSGIVYSDLVTTVSETYAEEITYPYFGENLEGVLKEYESKLSGIVNGIDYDEYNSMKDPLIFENYSKKNVVKGKKKNKLKLQEQMGLKQDADIPLIGIVSRLSDMKGFELIRHIMDELMQEDIQFVLLGTGESDIENAFRYFENKFPDKVRSNIMFSNDLAHKIYACSDIYLMPSKFEPCGLSQLIALRYGTIPIVRETGGLKDTITAYNKYEDTGNGFSFKVFNAHELLFKIKEAVNLYKDKKKWKSIVLRAMNTNNSWEKSAKEYIKLYKSLE